MGLFAASFCSHCKANLSLWEKAASLKGGEVRCALCSAKVKEALDHFLRDFREACSDALLTPQEWHAMWLKLKPSGATREEALRHIRIESVRFLDALIAASNADGIVTPDEEEYFKRMLKSLGISGLESENLSAKWNKAKLISEITRGILPTIFTDIHLDAGEKCHFDSPVVFQKVTAKGITSLYGRLIATDRKIHFLSPGSGGWSISYNSIMRLTQSQHLSQGAITFELSKKQGAGTYLVDDPGYAHLILATLIKIWRREIILGANETASRHIPQHVKIAVYQRDGGRCIECGASDYLEYDHIIPYSKGGASTTGNVQLLCRRCNSEKGDRL